MVQIIAISNFRVIGCEEAKFLYCSSRDRPPECLEISNVVDFQRSESLELMVVMTTITAIITENPVQV